MKSIDIKSVGTRTVRLEAAAISSLADQIDDQFEAAVEAIASNKGRLVVSGIGKSAIIAQKLVATLNSTGTPAIFLHAADAIHGDLGIVQQHDVVMVISKSGESPEIKVLVPLLRNFGNKLIAMVGNVNSYLARQAHIVLNTTVSQEACPNNLAPTSSTTAQLVMGDAIAIVLMELKGFGSDDFAKFHPGGTLGKKLYLRVSDLYTQNEKPRVQPDAPLAEVIREISKKRLGATVVTDENDKVVGVVTDGDLRRMLEKSISLETATARDIMTAGPKVIESNRLAVDALDLLRKHDITQLIVVEDQRYIGIIHLHDLIREGII
ncbi:MAG: KpsF/GutQ family sugar-phosphate isomerase [Chitinophagaceae bacterium]|nr:MAG: KpsF/GutQ family sugar-phosphate isomerase [Chitinophagaceae bacterium]